MIRSTMDPSANISSKLNNEIMSSNVSGTSVSDQTPLESHTSDQNNSNSANIPVMLADQQESLNGSAHNAAIGNDKIPTTPGQDAADSNTPKSAQSNKVRRSRPDTAPPLDESLKEMSVIIQRCVKELVKDPNVGVAFEEMLQWFKGNDSPLELTDPATLEAAINREMTYVKIKRLENGNYALAKKRGRPFGTGLLGLKRTTSGNHNRPSFGDYSRPPKRQRHSDGARHKHSPSSYVTTPKTPTSENLNNSASAKPKGDTPICDFCLQTAASNRKGQYEALLMCKDCPARAHPTCMKYNDILARRAALSPWQCIDCKTCCLCLDAGDPDGLLFCDSCDKGYHMSCHEPTLSQKPNNKWACTTCLKAGVNIDDIIADSNSNQSHAALGDNNDNVFVETAPRTMVNGDNSQRRSSYQQKSNKQDLPSSVRNWSCRNVRTYITQCGFPKEAAIFFEQEIDGQSLLLLQRQDILTAMNFKLGPALKISEKIKLLQSGSRYPPLGED